MRGGGRRRAAFFRFGSVVAVSRLEKVKVMKKEKKEVKTTFRGRDLHASTRKRANKRLRLRVKKKQVMQIVTPEMIKKNNGEGNGPRNETRAVVWGNDGDGYGAL